MHHEAEAYIQIRQDIGEKWHEEGDLGDKWNSPPTKVTGTLRKRHEKGDDNIMQVTHKKNKV